MGVACHDIALPYHWRVNDISTGIIYKSCRMGFGFDKLGIMKLMPPPFLAVHHYTSLTQ